MAMDMTMLVPGRATVDEWRTLNDVILWSRIDENIAKSLLAALGDQDCQSIPLFAMTDPEAMRKLLLQLELSTANGPRTLSHFEKARLNLLYAGARHRVKLGLVDICTPAVEAAPSQMTVGAPQAGGAQVIGQPDVKVKIANTFDQGSDMETTMLSPDEIRAKRRVFIQVFGDAPDPDENISDKQLSALTRVVAARQSIAADFAIFGPYGDRTDRCTKFVDHISGPNNTWRMKEVPGAPSLEGWLECWRVFRTGAVMEGLASPVTLDKYSAAFAKMARRYPDCWHVAARADQRCRSEFWVEERRDLEEFHDANPSLSTLNPLMPWDAVIRSSVTSLEGRDFWSREYTDLVNHFKNSGGQTIDPSAGAAQRANLLGMVHQGKGAAGASQRDDYDNRRPEWRQPKGGKPANAKGTPKGGKPSKGVIKNGDLNKQGKFYKDAHGTQLCFGWNRSANGCSKVCPAKRAHVCEICRGNHRAVHCKSAPGVATKPAAGAAAASTEGSG